MLLLLYFESLFSILDMFDFFFGWRKASKWFIIFLYSLLLMKVINYCAFNKDYMWVFFLSSLLMNSKKLIKRVQCRLKLLKNKRQSIVRNLRQDMAQLIKYDHVDIAFNRVYISLFRFNTQLKTAFNSELKLLPN